MKISYSRKFKIKILVEISKDFNIERGGSIIEKFEFTYQDYLEYLNKTDEICYDYSTEETLYVMEKETKYQLEN